MSILRNGNQIAISGAEFEALRQELLNEFQNKYITFQGETLLVTTVINRLFETANGKANIVLADTLPATLIENTQYYVTTYDGTTLTDARHIIFTDSLKQPTYIGTTAIDMSNLYEKPQADYIIASGDTITVQALKDQITKGQPISLNGKICWKSTEDTTTYTYTCLSRNDVTGNNNLNIITINKTTWVVTFNANDIVGNSLEDLVTEDTPYTSAPADSDTLDTINITTARQKKITFGNLWTWVLTKISGVCEKGIQVASGKIGHTNNITANTTNGLKTFAYDSNGHITSATAKTLGRGLNDSSNVIGHSNAEITAVTANDRMYPIKVDKYGHITATGTGHAITDQYTSASNNQLFTRNGANGLWTEATKTSNMNEGSVGIVFQGLENSFVYNNTIWAVQLSKKVFAICIEIYRNASTSAGTEVRVLNNDSNFKVGGNKVKSGALTAISVSDSSPIGCVYNGVSFFISPTKTLGSGTSNRVRITGIVYCY